jgi:ribosomal protein L37AE/L43A
MPENMENVVRTDLPAWDYQHGRVIGKMPVCPKCGKDTLVMTSPGFALCEYCRVWIEKSGELKG